MKITKKSDLRTVASIVCDCLLKNGIDAVLSGGAVVSIYTNKKRRGSPVFSGVIAVR